MKNARIISSINCNKFEGIAGSVTITVYLEKDKWISKCKDTAGLLQKSKVSTYCECDIKQVE